MTKEDGRRGVKRVNPELIKPRKITSNTPDSYGTDVPAKEASSGSTDSDAGESGGGQ